MSGIHGVLLMLTGVIHIVFGLLPFMYFTDWQRFFMAGLWNTVSRDSDRGMAAFWFVIAGLLMFLIGLAIFEIERRTAILPLSIGLVFLGMTLFGCVMAPKSGFTLLLLPQAVFYLYSCLSP